MKYKAPAIILILFLFVSSLGFSQIFERARNESRTFKVYDETSLEIYNKYGNIHLFTWDKDSVHIDISLKVKASKQQKADKIYEFIDFEFSNSKYYIVARTQLKQNQGGFWSELSDLANTVFSGNNKTEINYNIYLPADIPIKIENKFGNIYCSDHNGEFDLNLSNGDFKANDLTGEVKLDLSFGNAGINSIGNGSLKANYLELELGYAGDLTAESKSSTYNIEKVDILKLNSRRDKFFINTLGSIVGTTSFSYLTIRGFSKNVRLTSEYGEMKMKGIQNSFSVIDINAKYTDIVFQVSDDLNCFVDIEQTESTGIYYPDHFTGLSVIPYDKKEEKAYTKGHIGNKERAVGGIKITIQSGKVAFQDEIQVF